jgi:hypothetical protein
MANAQYKPSFAPKWIYTGTVNLTDFAEGETMVTTTVSSAFAPARVGDFFHVFAPSLEANCFTTTGVVTTKGTIAIKIGKTNINALAMASQTIVVVAY